MSDNSLTQEQLTSMANAVRALSFDAVEKAASGHPGMPMGMADVATVLFSEFLRFNSQDTNWPDRDRFVLSAGHGSMLLYSLLHLSGYPDMTLDEIKNFRQLGARTAGHPEYGHASGIETTTGPLGQGLANGVGMALAEAMLQSRFNADLVNHYTYVIAGDGCLMEGISQEAISLAGHLRLQKLIVLFDDNGITIDGSTSLSTSEDQLARFVASGWNTIAIDGHDQQQIRAAIKAARQSDKPTLIACKTIIGFGAPNKEGSSGAHGSPLGEQEIVKAREKLQWPHDAFVIPDAIRDLWLQASQRSIGEYQQWHERLQQSTEDVQKKWHSIYDQPLHLDEAINQFKRNSSEQKPSVATRKSSEAVLDAICPQLPWLVGGSADLTGSNNTKAKNQTPVTPTDFSGDYIYYGIREHAMAAAMNGIALHGGLSPYGGTFFTFSDYCRPAIRLSALMKQRVIYVMTHDSIGMGEDGPTHQPVEHLAAMRAIPDLLVMRPADTVETAECWLSALKNQGPSVLVLTRQNLPTLRLEHTDTNLSALGAYVVHSPESIDITLLATGSEVALAQQAALQLAEENISASVVSMPCWELFEAQPEEYRRKVLGSTPRLSIEAASSFGWMRYADDCISLDSFGASAPAPELFTLFGITVDNVCQKAKAMTGAQQPTP